MNTQVIREKFSKAAPNYDKHANIQKYFGGMLLEMLRQDQVTATHILDIGTGTGNLLQGLNSLYPSANILGLDISWGMLSKAKERASRLLQADAASLPFKGHSLDLVFSNLSLQWVVDPENVFSEVSRALKKRGAFYFTTFGPQTLQELKTVFPALNGRLRPHDLLTLENLLKQTGFCNIQSRSILKKIIYPNMIDIIRWLKNIGANYTGYIPAKNLGMRKVWQETEMSYKSQFSRDEGVYATFEAFLVKARKK